MFHLIWVLMNNTEKRNADDAVLREMLSVALIRRVMDSNLKGTTKTKVNFPESKALIVNYKIIPKWCLESLRLMTTWSMQLNQ